MSLSAHGQMTGRTLAIALLVTTIQDPALGARQKNVALNARAREAHNVSSNLTLTPEEVQTFFRRTRHHALTWMPGGERPKGHFLELGGLRVVKVAEFFGIGGCEGIFYTLQGFIKGEQERIVSIANPFNGAENYAATSAGCMKLTGREASAEFNLDGEGRDWLRQVRPKLPVRGLDQDVHRDFDITKIVLTLQFDTHSVVSATLAFKQRTGDIGSTLNFESLSASWARANPRQPVLTKCSDIKGMANQCAVNDRVIVNVKVRRKGGTAPFEGRILQVPSSMELFINYNRESFRVSGMFPLDQVQKFV